MFKVVHPFNRPNLFYEASLPSPTSHLICHSYATHLPHHPFPSVLYTPLHDQVRYLPNPNPGSQMENIFEYITSLHQRRKRPSSGIIYCRARATCDELAAYLRDKGLSARPYHRGLKCVVESFSWILMILICLSSPYPIQDQQRSTRP